MRPAHGEEEGSHAKAPEASEGSRAHLLAGGALLLAAAVAVIQQAPLPRTHAAASAEATAPATGPHRRAIASLGPLHTGETIGDGWRIDRIEALADEVQIGVSRGGAALTLGLAAPASRNEPALVPMSDVYVWYSGASINNDALTSLIEALAAKLRNAAPGQPLHQRAMTWSADAPEARP